APAPRTPRRPGTTSPRRPRNAVPRAAARTHHRVAGGGDQWETGSGRVLEAITEDVGGAAEGRDEGQSLCVVVGIADQERRAVGADQVQRSRAMLLLPQEGAERLVPGERLGLLVEQRGL